ncbi:hypothetical protein JCM1840_001488 [Sporobolomyces johnsonii]
MQFEDAPEDDLAAPIASAHAPVVDFKTARDVPGPFVDDEQPEQPESLSAAEEDEQPDWDSEDEYWDEAEGLEDGLNEVMDQDWADASGDFTKRYNRMKQQVVATRGPAAASGSAAGAHQAGSQATTRTGAVLPAINRARRRLQGPSATALNTAENGAAAATHGNKVSDQLALYSRFASRLRLEPLHTPGTATRKGGSEKILVKDKSDRATNEQVLDPRTRLILFKMLGRGLLERVDGCVSTGKEANVYHAVSPEGKHLALKIYKTSILVFKDRDRYVTGEFRFKNGYARSNPRKMVRLWAEKELRNLRRMKTAGLRVPEALEVRENVLVMEFMGQDEWQASPRLKDAQIPPEQLKPLYVEMLVILRVIFTRCKLVHADFSEYNILYHEGHLWVIDVSQSIEHEHPAAFDFLRADLQNAEDFFARRGVATLGLTRTFAFVTRAPSTGGRDETDEEIQREVERLLDEDEDELAAAGGADDDSSEPSTSRSAPAPQKGKAKPSASDEAVFAQSFIPRALDEVYDYERDAARVLRGEGGDLIYADITGVASIQGASGKGGVEAKGLEPVREGEGEGDGEADDDDAEGEGEDEGEDEAEEEDDEDSGDDKERRPRGKKFEDKEDKKKRRQEVKEKNREKRATKMPKAEKARRMKKSSGKR